MEYTLRYRMSTCAEQLQSKTYHSRQEAIKAANDYAHGDFGCAIYDISINWEPMPIDEREPEEKTGE